jgi:predicted enzyme related to lactoylglutathione lyase
MMGRWDSLLLVGDRPYYHRVADSYLRGELVVVIDCRDLERCATFWCAALGYTWPGTASGRYLTLTPPSGAGVEILLQRVPEEKLAKSPVHLDLRTRDLASEVERVTGLGAVRLTTEPIAEDRLLWHVLADPEGNEFCVLQPPEGYWPDPPDAAG